MSTSKPTRSRQNRIAVGGSAAVTAVMVLVGGLWLAGCLDREPSPVTSIPAAVPSAQPADFVWVASPMAVIRMAGATATTATLTAPHYTLGLQWLQRMERISASDSAQLNLAQTGGGVQAADGHEFVMAQLRDSGVGMYGRWPQASGQPSAQVQIVIGDREAYPLLKAPEKQDVIVVSAPRDTPVLIRVVDEGRGQSLDLRTGKPAADIHPVYARPQRFGQTTFGYGNKGTVRIGGRTRQITTDIAAPPVAQLVVGLEPWTPRHGWAAPGRAWLVVGPLSVHSDATDEKPFSVLYNLDLAKSFTLLMPDGVRVSAQPNEIQTWLPSGQAQFNAFFDVPDTFTGATLRLTPDGFVGAPGKGTWVSRPPAKDFALAITR